MKQYVVQLLISILFALLRKKYGIEHDVLASDYARFISRDFL